MTIRYLLLRDWPTREGNSPFLCASLPCSDNVPSFLRPRSLRAFLLRLRIPSLFLFSSRTPWSFFRANDHSFVCQRHPARPGLDCGRLPCGKPLRRCLRLPLPSSHGPAALGDVLVFSFLSLPLNIFSPKVTILGFWSCQEPRCPTHASDATHPPQIHLSRLRSSVGTEIALSAFSGSIHTGMSVEVNVRCVLIVYNDYFVKSRCLANTFDEGFILMRASLDPVILSNTTSNL